ncbi:unnamed protein product [Amaranthus hypochondriacus]
MTGALTPAYPSLIQRLRHNTRNRIHINCMETDTLAYLPCRGNRNQAVRMMVTRRQLNTTFSWVAIVTIYQGMISEPVTAAEKADDKQEDEGVLDTIKSLFDPNEKTKSGKVLPKAYLKSAREVIKNLRESLKEDPKDNAKFRRTADSAKESIREYLINWRGQPALTKEESYMELEKVIRSLASFYAKAGPSASLSDEVKTEILHDLDIAEQFL